MVPIMVVAFVVIPLAELAVIVLVADRIGIGWTIFSLLAMSVIGAYLAKREGVAVYRRFRTSLARREVPSGEVLDGFLVLLGAALLLTPGYLTDLIGLLLILPPSRLAVKRTLTQWTKRRFGRKFGVTPGQVGPNRSATQTSKQPPRRVHAERVDGVPKPASSPRETSEESP